MSHTYFGAEIIDLFFHCDLRDGNSINTKTEWRSGLVVDLQNALTRSTSYIAFMDSTKIWNEIEIVVDSSEDSLLHVSEELIILSKLQYDSMFEPITMISQSIKSTIRNQSEIFIKVVEYYLVKMEFAVSFRYKINKTYFTLICNIFSSDFLNEIQSCLQFFSIQLKNNIIRGFQQLRIVLEHGKKLSQDVRHKVFLFTTNIDKSFKVFGNLINKLILKFEDFLEKVSFKYQQILEEIRRKSTESRERIIQTLKMEFLKMYQETYEMIKDYQIFKDIVIFHHQFVSWFQEKIIAGVLDSIENLKR